MSSNLQTLDAGKVVDVLRAQTFSSVFGGGHFALNGDRINLAFAAYQWVSEHIQVKESLSR